MAKRKTDGSGKTRKVNGKAGAKAPHQVKARTAKPGDGEAAAHQVKAPTTPAPSSSAAATGATPRIEVDAATAQSPAPAATPPAWLPIMLPRPAAERLETALHLADNADRLMDFQGENGKHGDTPADLNEPIKGAETAFWAAWNAAGWVVLLHNHGRYADVAQQFQAQPPAASPRVKLTARDVALANVTARIDSTSGTSARFAGLDLSGLDLSDMDLSHADFSRCNLRGACLAGADLTGALFADADLTDADLSKAMLDDPQTDFTGAKLVRASLRGTCATGANFERADLTDADFSDAHIDEAIMADCVMIRTIFTNVEADGLTVRVDTLDAAIVKGGSWERLTVWQPIEPTAGIGGAKL